MIAREWFLIYHRDRASRSDHLPRRCTDDWKTRIRKFPIRMILVGDRIVELAVFNHLSPDPAVDAAAQVLDELAVDEWINWRSRFFRVDRDVNRRDAGWCFVSAHGHYESQKRDKRK